MDVFSAQRQKANGDLPASVRPDGIFMYPGSTSDGNANIEPSFYEMKATSAVITPKYRKSQITGMIDVLQKMMKDKNESFSALTLVTTADTEEIINYATKNLVAIFQSVRAIDDETGEFIVSSKNVIKS